MCHKKTGGKKKQNMIQEYSATQKPGQIKNTPDFEKLTPDVMISAVEAAIGSKMAGLISPLPSYINRVYEMQAHDGTRLIAKFYRPGRWAYEALDQEHIFTADCAADEIPVIKPLTLQNNATLDTVEGIHFAVFPKRGGRDFEVNEDEDWIRIGRLVARIHIAGKQRTADARVRLHPENSTAADIRHLVEGGFVSQAEISDFKAVCMQIVDMSSNLFDGIENIRIHGDCHHGNILHRPGEGVMIIDFDDMMTGPPVQDIWLLLPNHANRSRREFELIMEGYEQFRRFERHTFKLIEPLRAMRIIYFLAWCSRQADDFQFKKNFPDWGSQNFWKKEINDLRRQLQAIREHID